MAALLVQKLHADARLPRRMDPGAAGYDISSLMDFCIDPGDQQAVATGLALTVPEGTYGRLASRSGLATRRITVQGGVIDRSYTGEVKVILQNLGSEPFLGRRGDRIAQLILEKIETVPVQEVIELQSSLRGDAGFGSTG